MSFITKRERVFNEYDLFDLPARNEGKLKAYASCTDARAWSHFCSDKTEHLVEIIKKNNDKCAPKYVPTTVIVDTLMFTKNAEIGRLKRKIEALEQMLAVYDELNLDCTQKCEIAKAHEAIKAANKELDEMCLDLDLSGFTEGMDSEVFETGKSRGDETEKSRQKEIGYDRHSTPRVDSKAIQLSNMDMDTCTCEASTIAIDPRIEEMQEDIITKDAKLSAMQNTIAVMENDVCEPYCVYAHIYTALEKIFGILYQNDKYKEYLNLLTAGKDTRCIDIKGKILFKMKVLEKFCLALIAPCSQDFNKSQSSTDCSCYQALVARVETTFALTSAEARQPSSLDNKRAQLVAEIMDNTEMKEILSRESCFVTDGEQTDEELAVEYYNVDTENLNRLKDLQKSYDELMVCYENLKHERDCLQLRCRKYNELEAELEQLQCQVRSYNALWNEKEHYRKRSEDLDNLKEKFVVLCDEATELETQLKAENEKNYNKSKTIEELRRESVQLEKKLNETAIAFEREKNSLLCKLKETECKCMCQDQQVKQLTVQLDKHMEKTQNKEQLHAENSIDLLNEIETLKNQTKNLKDLLFCSEEEKLHLQEQFADKLDLISDLKNEIEHWKSCYEQLNNHDNNFEKYTENLSKLEEENKFLLLTVEDKDKAIQNLMDVISDKSQEMNKLLSEIDQKRSESNNLLKQLKTLETMYSTQINSIANDKQAVMKQLDLEKQESLELLTKVKDYDAIIRKNEEDIQSLQTKSQDYDNLQNMLSDIIEKNKALQADNDKLENNNNLLLREIKKIQEENGLLKEEATNTKRQRDAVIQECDSLQNKFENLSEELTQVRQKNNQLEMALERKSADLNDANNYIALSQRQSSDLLDKTQHSEKLKQELFEMKETYKKLVDEKYALKNSLAERNSNIDSLIQELNKLKKDKAKICDTQVPALEQEVERLSKAFKKVQDENIKLRDDIIQKSVQIDDFVNKLRDKENQLKQQEELRNQNSELKQHISKLEKRHAEANQSIQNLEDKSKEFVHKLKYYEHLADDFDTLNHDYNNARTENEKLKEEINHLNNQLRSLDQAKQNFEDVLQNKSSSQYAVPEFDYDYIKQEMDKLKQDKIASSNKIRELLNKIDENENTISNLAQDLLARDDKVAMLENHINNLKDEIQYLHQNLEEGLSAGQEVVGKGLKQMEAHHSKATHNMKVELAKLQKDNALLEEKLSTTVLKNESSLQDKNKFVSQIKQLQNERDVIVSELQQLEIISIGDSELSPDNYDVKHVVETIDRIRRSFEARNSQNSTLEQTIIKMQSSSQLVLSKADKAKKIAENEIQKILNEKEDAIKERLYLERKLKEIEAQLKEQVSKDEKVIKDLESEILNQKLIINKINESSQNYISKLKSEIDDLKDLYQNSLTKIESLETQLKNLTHENNNTLELTDKIKLSLEEKCKEIEELQAEIIKLQSQEKEKHKSVDNKLVEKYSQTTTDQSNKIETSNVTQVLNDASKQSSDPYRNNLLENIGGVKTKKRNEHKIISSESSTNVNEVQILTANVEPNLDLVKNIYQNYKINKLSPGPLELNSIASLDDDEDSIDNAKYELSQSEYILEEDKSPPLIDIYSNNETTKLDDFNETPSEHKDIFEQDNTVFVNFPKSQTLNSTKINENLANIKKDPKTEKSRLNTEFQLENEGSENESHSKKSREAVSFIATVSDETNPDKDVFMIYRDSDSAKSKLSHESLKTENLTINNRIISKSDEKIPKRNVAFPTENSQDNKKQMIRPNTKTETPIVKKSAIKKEINEDKKESLHITLPGVRYENPALALTPSDGENKSVGLYAVVVKTHPMSENKTRSDIDLKEKYLQDKTKTPSLPSLSNDHYYQDSLYSIEMGSDEETIRKIIRKQLSDTDDEKLKQKENALKSNKSSIKTEGETSIETGENTYEQTSEESHHKLTRVAADVLVHNTTKEKSKSITRHPQKTDFGLEYILDSVRQENYPKNFKQYENKNNSESRNSSSDERKFLPTEKYKDGSNALTEIQNKDKFISTLSISDHETLSKSSQTNLVQDYENKIVAEKGILVSIDPTEYYEKRILTLTKTIENIDKDYKKKLEAIKAQYDTNIKTIITEHNHGVKSIQNLHEETLQDIMRTHESEVENLRGMSMEAMRKADKLAKVNKDLMNKIGDSLDGLDKEPVKISGSEQRSCRSRVRTTKTLSKTSVESFNVKPKARPTGPCNCTLDSNVSDTIRNIFDQVDVEQRKMAEYAYMKYIANKMLTGNVENLDAQELSFLHYKVCRSWKSKLSKEEALQRRIDALESELMSKQKNAQHHIAELDRKVAEERRRLQEVREAVCNTTPAASREVSPDPALPPARPNTAAEKDVGCNCNIGRPCKPCKLERKSAGDLTAAAAQHSRPKRPKTEYLKAAFTKLATDDRRGDRRLYSDEQPTRLRKTRDRSSARPHKK